MLLLVFAEPFPQDFEQVREHGVPRLSGLAFGLAARRPLVYLAFSSTRLRT
jgi:hypothetical protein